MSTNIHTQARTGNSETAKHSVSHRMGVFMKNQNRQRAQF